MPDFTAKITTGAVKAVWTDPATAEAPSRINPLPRHPHTHRLVGDLNPQVIAKATVAGVEGPLDAALDGRLFQWRWVEYPASAGGMSLPVISSPAGQTSVAEIDDFPDGVVAWRGHWVLMCSRDAGGGVMLPFDVEVVA